MGLNFLLSDGRSLYAFRYSKYNRDYYSLFWLKRDSAEPGPLEYLSDETSALIHSKSLRGEKTVLVCSERLTEENWKEIKVGTLLVVSPNPIVEKVKILSMN